MRHAIRPMACGLYGMVGRPHVSEVRRLHIDCALAKQSAQFCLGPRILNPRTQLLLCMMGRGRATATPLTLATAIALYLQKE